MARGLTGFNGLAGGARGSYLVSRVLELTYMASRLANATAGASNDVLRGRHLPSNSTDSTRQHG